MSVARLLFAYPTAKPKIQAVLLYILAPTPYISQSSRAIPQEYLEYMIRETKT